MDYDAIEFYSDAEIKAWIDRFNSSPIDVIIISDIPFSYYELVAEVIRRANIEI